MDWMRLLLAAIITIIWTATTSSCRSVHGFLHQGARRSMMIGPNRSKGFAFRRRLERDNRNHLTPLSTDNNGDAITWNDSSRRHLLRQVVGITAGISTSTRICVDSSSTMRKQMGSHSSPCLALSPEEASKAYNSYASQYDQLDGGDASTMLGIDEARAKLIRQARGRVLEIGAGTGLNLPYYDPERVTSLTLVDISDGMLEQAKLRVQSTLPRISFPVTFLRADATTRDLVVKFQEGLEWKDDHPLESLLFDTVVDSFSLCVMGNEGARQCLVQLRDVVKDYDHGGQILLLENSKSTQPLLAWYQDLTAESAAALGGKGCVYNQDVRAMIQSIGGGLTIESEESYASGLFRAFVCTKRTFL